MCVHITKPNKTQKLLNKQKKALQKALSSQTIAIFKSECNLTHIPTTKEQIRKSIKLKQQEDEATTLQLLATNQSLTSISGSICTNQHINRKTIKLALKRWKTYLAPAKPPPYLQQLNNLLSISPLQSPRKSS